MAATKDNAQQAIEALGLEGAFFLEATATPDQKSAVLKKHLGDILERIAKIDDPQRQEWYRNLLVCALGDHNWNVPAALRQADAIFAEHPEDSSGNG